jgi:phenylalanyl-tRNA synthetase beta chain
VDITNYVMLELGQPLHAFDLDRVSEISVRFAESGEALSLINGEAIELDPGYLVIADHERPIALAGIMGGMQSAVGNETRHLFLESAFFSPEAIGGRGRRLGFGTDSSHRFERGVDFEMTRKALERATRLILEICGGKAGPITELRDRLPPREPIAVRLLRVQRVLGVALSNGEVCALLKRLGFSFDAQKDAVHVLPPSYRFDLKREEDLVEELARLYGYERIPATPPRAELNILPAPEGKRDADVLRNLLAARDYQEIVSYSFVDPAWEADLAGNANPVVIRNPLATQLSVMRSTLFGGLLDCLRQNANRKQSRARLFEVGCCFAREGDGYVEPERLSGLCYGSAHPEQWGVPAAPVGFFDVKADLEALFAPAHPSFEPSAHPALHPGKSARIVLSGEAAGWLGELHPKWREKYELPQAPILFELDLQSLLKRTVPVAGEISKFPPVRRDISVLVELATPAEALVAAMREVAPEQVSEIALFDLYHGEGIAAGEKSLAFRVLLQDTRKTLTESEVDSVIVKLVEVLERRFGARLRAPGGQP